MRQIVFAMLGLFLCGTVHAAPCDVGQYLNNGVCSNCVYNATCDGERYVCTDGFYDNGANECVACPPNSICTSPTEFTCTPGAYMSDGVCNACPKNATCDGGLAPFHCNDGWYQYVNQCISCDGHACDGDVLQSCGDGFVRYPFGDVLKPYKQYCVRCGTGYWCPAGTTRYICDTGFYKNGNGTCTKCPAEYYCPRDSNVSNLYDYCAPGYYRTGNSCSKCDDDIECPGGVQIKCSAGLFAHFNGQCLPYSENDSGVSGDCHPGYYDTGSQCLSCPDNSICSSPDDFQCRAGFYNNDGNCDICPANSVCPESSSQITCMPGYWLNGNVCDKCGASAYCYDNIKYACPSFNPDNFVLSDDNFVILSWTSPYSVQRPIASSASSCTIGSVRVKTARGEYLIYWPSWSVEKERYSGGTKVWKLAASGYYLSGPQNLNSEIVYKNILQCTNAPEHATYIGSGTPDGNDCPWRCDDGYLRDGNSCTMCPSGYVCINGLLVCPAGQYANGMECASCPDFYDARSADNIAPQSINECQIQCDAATYLPDANGTQCVPVGTAFWNPVNYTYYGSVGTRQQCPDNLTTIGYGSGADDVSDCGKILHIGNYTLRMHIGKETSPSLAVQYGDRVLYGDMSRGKRGVLRAEYKGLIYSVFNMNIE
ncbi:MAG: hypothetical protein NC311_06260 [Muribaculaceae bacterium]|nr:hypothetical protein [Muribaculaceae bacterium]